MNFDVYQRTRTAALVIGTEIPTELSSWRIGDLDAFFENLGLWYEGDDEIEALFGIPTLIGTKQYLADIQRLNVGLSGDVLRNPDILKQVRAKYLEHGYTVLVIKGEKVDATEPSPDKKVRIVWE